jgi:transcriptional regulator with XRE-family HTH domain
MARGLTEEELAEAIGISLPTYRRRERNDMDNPVSGHLVNAALALGVERTKQPRSPEVGHDAPATDSRKSLAITCERTLLGYASQASRLAGATANSANHADRAETLPSTSKDAPASYLETEASN